MKLNFHWDLYILVNLDNRSNQNQQKSNNMQVPLQVLVSLTQ